MKPVKAAGKQKTPPQTASGAPDKAPTGQSIFEDALCSIQEELAIKLWEDAQACEISTRDAVLAAQPAEKLSAFHSGFEKWGAELCASISEYYPDCFTIARKNRLQHDYLLSPLKISSTDKFRNPAEFAKGLTEVEISAFLRISPLDRNDPAREGGSGGRVREFVRHVCGDLSDVYPSLRTEQNTVFRLPQWFDTKWNAKAHLAKLAWRPPGQAPRTPTIDESITLSIEETEKFILGWEDLLVSRLRVAITTARRKARIVLGKTGIATWSSKTGASLSQNNYTSPTTSKRSDKVCFRHGIIFRAIESRKTGLDYCQFLDANGLTTPDSWRGDGCPESYSLAYQKAGRLGRVFQHRINTEKNRSSTLRSKLEREDSAELNRILGISRGCQP